MEQWEIDLTTALGTSKLVAAGAKNVNDDDDDSDPMKDNARMFDKLARIADIFADVGIIHNTPYAKQQWISGR